MINLFCQCQGVYLTSVLNQVLNFSDLVNSNLKNSLPSIEVLKNRLKSLGVTSKPIDFKASSSFSLLSPSNSSLTFELYYDLLPV